MQEMPDELILMNSPKKDDYSAFLVSKEDHGGAIGFKFHIITEDGQGMNALVPKDRLMPLYAYLKHHLGV